MFKKEQMFVMCQMQDGLNSSVNPDWVNQGWDWDLAVKMETSELIESFQWKHWKSVDSKKADIENAKVELIDVLHFLLSADIEYWNTDEGASAIKEDETVHGTIHKDYNLCMNRYPLEEGKDALFYARKFIKLDPKFTSMEEYIGTFFLIMKSLGMNADELYKGYITKNVLNRFRQANGYKEGTYKKMWTGPDGIVVEDNVIAFGLAEQFDADETLVDNLTKALEDYYKVA